MGLAAYADADPGKLIGVEVGDDVLQAVMSTGGTVLTDAQLAGGEGYLVREDDDMLRGNLEEGGGLLHRFAGQVHIGDGLHHQHLLSGYGEDIGQTP